MLPQVGAYEELHQKRNQGAHGSFRAREVPLRQRRAESEGQKGSVLWAEGAAGQGPEAAGANHPEVQ